MTQYVGCTGDAKTETELSPSKKKIRATVCVCVSLWNDIVSILVSYWHQVAQSKCLVAKWWKFL